MLQSDISDQRGCPSTLFFKDAKSKDFFVLKGAKEHDEKMDKKFGFSRFDYTEYFSCF